VYFIGDVHGKTKQLGELLSKLDKTQVAFQVGDMGLGFRDVSLDEYDPGEFRFIRGNHDSPEACRKHPNYAGDYGYLEHLELFFIGGVYFIDGPPYRTPGVSWWEDEQLSYDDLITAQRLYLKVKPRIVVTHEAPTLAAEELLRPMLIRSNNGYYDAKMECGTSRTSRFLQTMQTLHHPEHWYFGHYHVDREFKLLGTTFHCLAELSVKEHRP